MQLTTKFYSRDNPLQLCLGITAFTNVDNFSYTKTAYNSQSTINTRKSAKVRKTIWAKSHELFVGLMDYRCMENKKSVYKAKQAYLQGLRLK